MCFPPLRADGTKASPEGNGDHLRERHWLDSVIPLGGTIGSAPAVVPGSNPGLVENLFLLN